MQRIVLAYSGGLDTSIIVPWLREHYDAEVICVAADIGQGEGELDGIVEKALRSGAVSCTGEDLRQEFVESFVYPTLRAGARTYGVSTRDISQGGIKIDIDERLDEGQPAVLTLEGFRAVEGVVRWYQDGVCGIAFNQVIPFRELMTWLRAR